MLTKSEAGAAVRDAKARLGLTWAQLAEAVGRPPAWTVAALLGQHPITADQAKAALTFSVDQNTRAQSLLQSGEAAAAIPYLKKAASLRPEESVPHQGLAVAYEKLGQLTEAKQEEAEV